MRFANISSHVFQVLNLKAQQKATCTVRSGSEQREKRTPFELRTTLCCMSKGSTGALSAHYVIAEEYRPTDNKLIKPKI